MKPKAQDTYVQMDDSPWAPFEGFAEGGITWRLLNVCPEMGSWTAVFDCPAGSSFATHIHTGPGEYFLYKGKMDIRGGEQNGGFGFWPATTAVVCWASMKARALSRKARMPGTWTLAISPSLNLARSSTEHM